MARLFTENKSYFPLLESENDYLNVLKESVTEDYMKYLTEEDLKELQADFEELYMIDEITGAELIKHANRVRRDTDQAHHDYEKAEYMKQYQANVDKVQAARDAAAKSGEGTLSKLAKGASKLAQDPTAQKVALGVAAAAAVAGGAYAIYKRFFSQAAKACKGSSDRGACVTKFKIKGLNAAKAKLQSGLSKCGDEKCKAKIKAKIVAHQNKIAKLSSK